MSQVAVKSWRSSVFANILDIQSSLESFAERETTLRLVGDLGYGSTTTSGLRSSFLIVIAEDRKRVSHGDSPVDILVFTQRVSVSKYAAGQFLFKSQFIDDLLVTVMCQGDRFLQGGSIS